MPHRRISQQNVTRHARRSALHNDTDIAEARRQSSPANKCGLLLLMSDETRRTGPDSVWILRMTPFESYRECMMTDATHFCCGNANITTLTASLPQTLHPCSTLPKACLYYSTMRVIMHSKTNHSTQHIPLGASQLSLPIHHIISHSRRSVSASPVPRECSLYPGLSCWIASEMKWKSVSGDSCIIR
jgi:hypothetical protein